MTQQQQATTSRLDQTVVTTDTYPFSTQTSTLQTQTIPLNRTDYGLVQSSYPLTSTTKQLQESSYLLNSTPRILQSFIYNLEKTTTPLDEKTYKVTVGTQLLTQKDYKVTVGTQLLTQKDYKVTVGTQLLTQKDYKVTVGTRLLTEDVYRLTRTSYDLQSSTYMLQESTRRLQQRHEYSTDGGDTWQDTGWFNVAFGNSCTTRASGPGWRRNTVCRYDTAVTIGGQSSCTTIAPDTTSPYTVSPGGQLRLRDRTARLAGSNLRCRRPVHDIALFACGQLRLRRDTDRPERTGDVHGPRSDGTRVNGG